MNNLAYSQQTYLQSDISQQLNSLADRLDRIATICNNADDLSSALELVRESQYFIEWTAPNLSIDDATTLVNLGRILAAWGDWRNRLLVCESNHARFATLQPFLGDRLLDFALDEVLQQVV